MNKRKVVVYFHNAFETPKFTVNQEADISHVMSIDGLLFILGVDLKQGLTIVWLWTVTSTNYSKGKHLKLSLIIIEMLAYFTSKQLFTDFSTLLILVNDLL